MGWYACRSRIDDRDAGRRPLTFIMHAPRTLAARSGPGHLGGHGEPEASVSHANPTVLAGEEVYTSSVQDKSSMFITWKDTSPIENKLVVLIEKTLLIS